MLTVCAQAAISKLRARLNMTDAKGNSEELLASVLEVTNLILSLVMCNPASIRQIARMSMLDGSMSDVDQPQNPEALLVLSAPCFKYSDRQPRGFAFNCRAPLYAPQLQLTALDQLLHTP